MFAPSVRLVCRRAVSHVANSNRVSADKAGCCCRGAPISAVDITYDGHWVLSTSDFYLTVAPTQFKVGAQADVIATGSLAPQGNA